VASITSPNHPRAPFGANEFPQRWATARQELLVGPPAGVARQVWETACSDLADTLSFWGGKLAEFGWAGADFVALAGFQRGKSRASASVWLNWKTEGFSGSECSRFHLRRAPLIGASKKGKTFATATVPSSGRHMQA
jgi:hypothetical protein